METLQLSEKHFSKSQNNVSKSGEIKLGQEFLHGRRGRIQNSFVPDQGRCKNRPQFILDH